MKICSQMTNLGDYIEKLRTERRWSYRELADETPKDYRVSHGTIQDIESGKTSSPGIKAIVGLAKAFGINPMKLILAYTGQDPDKVPLNEGEDTEALLSRAIEALKKEKGKE